MISFFFLYQESSNAYEKAFYQNRDASHIINNPVILNPIREVINKMDQSSLLNVIVLRVDSVDMNHQNIYLKASNFETEAVYFNTSKNSSKLKGYLWVDNTQVLLFDESKVFFQRIDENYDIFKNTNDISTLVSVHTPYRYYEYKKDSIFGEIEEFIEFKGELDKIDN
ncbi:hypothetical protein BKM32_04470 [Mangrovimonas sp. DI 80]|nr:hypothetical protein BKM32_04470 [Mangrovimonas sp. DI 80]